MPTSSATAGADLLEALTAIAVSAALAVLCAGRAGVRIKADGSPVTAADDAADAVICDGLARLVPALPVISEERAGLAPPALAGASVILVDPLDGTRDFVAGRDEYAVNIALVTDGVPVLGVIAAPAAATLWRGVIGRGAERLKFAADGKTSAPEPIRTRPRGAGELAVMASRSHLDRETRAYIDALPRARLIPCASALKFCRVAEGAADLYPRLGPTRDWDVAAGHAIVAAAGGRVLAPDGGALAYGTAELRIPAFIAFGDPRPLTG